MSTFNISLQSGVVFANKLYTLEMLDYNKQSLPVNFCCPDNLVSMNGEISGFTMPKVEGINFLDLLNDKSVEVHEKLYYFKKIGEILNQMKNIRKYSNLKEFYINDLHESNLIVNPHNKELNVVDLDSCRIGNNGWFAAKLLNSNQYVKDKEHKYKYYEDNGDKFVIANGNSDLYCYNTMILNYLLGINSSKLNLNDFYDYLTQLKDIGFNKELIECFNKLTLTCDNENPVNYIDSITEKQVWRAKSLVHIKK